LTTYLEGQTGMLHDVLMENGGVGRTPQFAEVVMQGERIPEAGKLLRVHASRLEGDRLIGEVAA
jgi:threonylcarbamoyladenosine tRNA methylthiotransferase MtaB